MDKSTPPFFQTRFLLSSLLPGFKQRWLCTALPVLAGLITLIIYAESGPKASSFAQAESLAAKWIASPQDDNLFQEMFAALKKTPSLQQKYEAVVAQKFIEGGRGAEALQMACRSLEFAKNEIPFHADYAETSFLIEQGKYQTALERAVSLKERFGKECNIARFSTSPLAGGAVLYANNLLRIACLQQKLQNRPGEAAAWTDLEAFLQLPQDTFLSRFILNTFQEKGVNLSHYIAERKLALHSFL